MSSRLNLRLPILAGCLFVLLAVLAVGGWGPADAADRAISDRFRDLGNAHPTMIAWVKVATDVAATIPFLAAGVLLTLVLWVRGERHRATFTAVVTVAVPTLWSLMHLWLHHPRPPDGFVTVTSNGFPSGHTSNAAAAALVAICLLGRRPPVVVVAAVFALLIGLSRLILVVHWPTQVLGGWLLALAVVPPAAHALLPARPVTAPDARL